jgi:hypothetical protein
MNILTVVTLAALQFAPIQGARMPRHNLLGVRLDMLRREAHLVLGRKQGLFEVDADNRKPATDVFGDLVEAGQEPRDDLWRIEDGHSSALELPAARARRADTRMFLMKSGRPLRNFLLTPDVAEDRDPTRVDASR